MKEKKGEKEEKGLLALVGRFGVELYIGCVCYYEIPT